MGFGLGVCLCIVALIVCCCILLLSLWELFGVANGLGWFGLCSGVLGLVIWRRFDLACFGRLG